MRSRSLQGHLPANEESLTNSGFDSLQQVYGTVKVFRSSAALLWTIASKRYPIANVCLVNPRRGVFLQETLEGLTQELSGRPATEVLGDIVEYLSEPSDRHRSL